METQMSDFEMISTSEFRTMSTIESTCAHILIYANMNSCTAPKAVLAGVASFLIQKDTQERTTVRMQGMYVWIVK